jgi:hypothetical protein
MHQSAAKPSKGERGRDGEPLLRERESRDTLGMLREAEKRKGRRLLFAHMIDDR